MDQVLMGHLRTASTLFRWYLALQPSLCTEARPFSIAWTQEIICINNRKRVFQGIQPQHISINNCPSIFLCCLLINTQRRQRLTCDHLCITHYRSCTRHFPQMGTQQYNISKQHVESMFDYYWRKVSYWIHKQVTELADLWNRQAVY